MLKKCRLNLKYFFLSIAILSLLSFNMFYYSSSVVGSLMLLAYIICVGSWIGHLLFSKDPKLSQLLFGEIIIVCWIIVSEGILVIFKICTSELVILPLLALPLALQVLDILIGKQIVSKVNKDNHIDVKEHYTWSDILSLAVFMAALIGALWSALYIRNDLMLFSIWEVMPPYFWIFVFITVTSFVFLQKEIHNKLYGFEISMICSFLISFLYFGLMILVVKISFDPDIWVTLAKVRVIFNLGGRDPTGGLIIPKSGHQAFVLTFAKSMGKTFDLTSVRWVSFLWSPIMASIYIPFITYQFLRKLDSKHNVSHIFFLGIIGFMLFPNFWLMSVSVAEMVGDILMYVNLLFITIFLSDAKPYRGLFLTALTTVAAMLVHPFSGTFALMADLTALSFHRRLWKMKKLRLLLLMITAILAISIFPSEFTWIQKFLYKGISFQLNPISLEAVANFWFSPIWSPNQYTADSICSENFNWIRYALLIVGLLVLRPLKANDKGRVKKWLLLMIIIFWVGWFITTNGIKNLPYGTHRFARCVDLALLPLTSTILYKISKIATLSFIINGNVKMNIIINIITKLNKRRWGLTFSQNKISAIFMLSLIIVGMLSSFYIAYSIPSLFKNYPAEPGRPTWRTVTGDEMKIVKYIDNSSEGKNYCVLAYGYIPKLVAGVLGYRYYGKEQNLALSPGIIQESTDALMRKPSSLNIYNLMINTNSSVAFVVLEDWFIKLYSISEDDIEKLGSTASELKVFGENYRFFVFKYNLDKLYYSCFNYILPIDEYREESAIVIADDESEGFWKIIPSYGICKMSVPQIEFDDSTKLSGSESTRIVIGYGNYWTVGIVHFYDEHQNWSDKKYISFLCMATTLWRP